MHRNIIRMLLFTSAIVCVHAHAGDTFSRMISETSEPSLQASSAPVNTKQSRTQTRAAASSSTASWLYIGTSDEGKFVIGKKIGLEGDPWHDQHWRAMLNTHIITGIKSGVKDLFERKIIDEEGVERTRLDGTCVTTPDPNGKTPLQLAQEYKRADIIELLKRYQREAQNDGDPGPSSKKRSCESDDKRKSAKKVCSPALSTNDLVLSDDEE